MGTISVVIPTVAGREDHLERCLDTYRERTIHDLQLVVIHDRPYVGRAWNDAVPELTGDYFHFTADDLEPLEEWDARAVEFADRGIVPAPGMIRKFSRTGEIDRHLPDGQKVHATGSDISVIPFCTRAQFEMIGLFIDAHFFTDYFFSYRAIQAGIPIMGCTGYEFIHHYAQPRRGAGMTEEDRMTHDHGIYLAAVEAFHHP